VKKAASLSLNSPGLTFTIALWVLGVVAALQILAVFWKVVPAMIVRASMPSAQTAEIEAYRPPKVQPAVPAPSAPSVDPLAMQQAMNFSTEADRASRVGDWETAFAAIQQARKLLPTEPRLQLQEAFVLERLGREDEAQLLLSQLLQTSNLDPEIRQEAMRLSDWIEQTIANMEARGISRAPAASATTEFISEEADSVSSLPVVEETGLQPGATLGIVDSREIEGEPDSLTLRVAIKARPSTAVASNDVKVLVSFFERNQDGEILPTESPVRSQWISPPVDWADNEPEIIDFVVPRQSGESSALHGYIVAIYHRDELQDTRAVPGGLDQQFPPDLFLQP
jgi:hypothetical protein